MKEAKTGNTKNTLHPRNKHIHGYDFDALKKAEPSLRQYVHINRFQKETINFSLPEAVKALNKALLKLHYEIQDWDVPKGYLCPPVPGRADYIHHIADLLAEGHNGEIPTGNQVNILDIGTGANCIYPILGHREFGWQFVATETDEHALENARSIVFSNDNLKEGIRCRQQKNPAKIFKDIINKKEVFDAVICNPPFHTSKEEMEKGNQRKMKNLNINGKKTQLNFGGQSNELWYEGGEVAFIEKMINESTTLKNKAKWFTTLVSKKDNLPTIYRALKKVTPKRIETIDMAQGQKISRIVCWSFA